MSDSIPPPPLIVQPKANAIQEMTNVLREALTRLGENQANLNTIHEAPTSYTNKLKEFLSDRPHEFHSTMNPVTATNWITNMENIFDVCTCTSHQKATFAPMMLRNNAALWWEDLKRSFLIEERE